ncbi:MAG TPA: hypothetical protein EYP92_03295 [Candidatus Thioglobus sp.]|nr:hypothetical protein [Candidatus Thioglobus sp.]
MTLKTNAFTDYVRDEVLYQCFVDCARSDGLAIFDNPTFELLNNRYGREKMRTHLADYISTERPPFPLKHISRDRMIQTFLSLKRFKTSTICVPRDQIDRQVLEKYDDYKYSFKDHGLGLITGSSALNDVSNHFNQDLRLGCPSYSYRAPKEVWENGSPYDIWKHFGPIWRGINEVRREVVNGVETYKGGELAVNSYIAAFRLGTYTATQFKPVVAKAIYDITNAKTVLDTSCGWGDRLAGFFASSATEYYGCDPNPNTYKRYQKQIDAYNSILRNPKKVKIWNCGAEDLPYDELPPIDCAFTSPPYFSTEQYNKGGELQENQSWFKFNEYEKWRDEFYLPVAKKTMAVSKFMFVNIMDPKIKGVRYRSSDELVDSLQDNFMGQIGMRIMQRPQGKSVFRDGDGNFCKDQMDEFMNQIFIENIWCFSKDPEADVFGSLAPPTLESFFN